RSAPPAGRGDRQSGCRRSRSCLLCCPQMLRQWCATRRSAAATKWLRSAIDSLFVNAYWESTSCKIGLDSRRLHAGRVPTIVEALVLRLYEENFRVVIPIHSGGIHRWHFESTQARVCKGSNFPLDVCLFFSKKGVECHFSTGMEGIPREKRLRLQKYSPPRSGGECALVTRDPAGNNRML